MAGGKESPVKHRAVIGIEISKEEVRGACIRAGGGGITLAGLASTAMPAEGLDPEGALSTPEVAEAVRRVCAQLDPKATHVVVGMTGCNLVARVMEIPPVPDPEVRSVLRGEMDHYRILPAGQSAFDFYRLPDLPDHDGEPEEKVSRVLLMGAEERIVSSYRAVADASGINLLAVEPGSIALLRALYPLVRGEEAVATVYVSSAGTDIFITQRGELQFYRRIDTGVPELRSHAPASADAGGALPQIRTGMLLGEADDLPAPAPPPRLEAPEAYNRQAISLLMTEVQRSIDYFVREYPSAGETITVQCAMDCADADELFAIMCQYLRSQARLATAMDTVNLAPEAALELRDPRGLSYTVALGLALRGHPDYSDAPMLDLGVGDRVIVERRLAPRVLVASMAASGVVLVGTMLAALVVGQAISRANTQLRQTQAELAALTAEHAARVAALERQKTITEAIAKSDKPIREAVDFLAASVSRRACLTSIAIDKNGAIFLSGEADSPRIVADIMDVVNMSPVLEPVKLNLLNRMVPRVGSGVKFDLQTSFLQPLIAASVAAPAAPPAKTGGGA